MAEIKKIEEGMRGEAVADLIADNFELTTAPDWTAQEYKGAIIVSHEGKIFRLTKGVTAAANEVPNVSPKWQLRGGGEGYEIVTQNPVPVVNFTRDRAYEMITLETDYTLRVDLTDAKLGVLVVLKFTGSNVVFGNNIILDSSSDSYDPFAGNVIYLWYEYRSVRAVLKNSDLKGFNPSAPTTQLLMTFPQQPIPYEQYQPQTGARPTPLYNVMIVGNGRLTAADTSDTGLALFTAFPTYEVLASADTGNLRMGFGSRLSGFIIFDRTAGTYHIIGVNNPTPTSAYTAGVNNYRLRYSGGILTLWINNVQVFNGAVTEGADEESYLGIQGGYFTRIEVKGAV